RCYRLTDAERAANEAEGEPWAIRLFVPEGTTSFEDIVTGEVTFRHEDLDDVIIVRSDGRPLYNLAVSVDDGIMKMTHVIRGLDLQSSTPYQIIMHKFFGHEIPQYAHVPLVTGPGGQKLSKRFGGDTLEAFRSKGYLPETMVNYLALLGWGTADQTILSRDELISKFELDKVHASPAMVDPDKLDWMNGEYIRMLHDGQLAERITPWLVNAGLVADPPSAQEWAAIEVAASVVKTRIKRLEEVPDMIRSWFTDVEPNTGDFERVMREPFVPALLGKTEDRLTAITEWDKESIEGVLRSVVEQLDVKPRVAFRPLYVAITGAAASAPLFDSMEVIGQAKCLERIKRTRALLENS
ncbi:MAG: glutamate--tRNA ligase, partial [Acidimicrobiia bacterium]